MPTPPISRTVGAVVGAALIALCIALAYFFDLLLFPLAFGGTVAYFTFFLPVRYSGRDLLRFDATSVEVCRGRTPWRQRMKIADIEELLTHRDDLVLMGDHQYIHVNRPASDHDRELLQQFIERQLSRRQSTDV